MPDTDAPPVEPLTLTLEEGLKHLWARGFVLVPPDGSTETWGASVADAPDEEWGTWPEAVSAALGRPVVERDDTAYWRLSAHVENALAPVLGYEYDEAVGWNVGEHTAESLVMAAASRIAELVAALEAWLAWVAKNQADLYFGDLPESSFTQVGDLVVTSRAVLARVKEQR